MNAFAKSPRDQVGDIEFLLCPVCGAREFIVAMEPARPLPGKSNPRWHIVCGSTTRSPTGELGVCIARGILRDDGEVDWT